MTTVKIEVGDKNNPVNLTPLKDAIFRGGVGVTSIGQKRLAQVVKADPVNGYVELYVISDKSNAKTIYPGFMNDPTGTSGLWYGLSRGDIVLCGIGFGGTYFIENRIGNSNTIYQDQNALDTQVSSFFFTNGSSIQTANLSDLKGGDYLLKSGEAKIKISKDEGLFVGNLGYGSINFDINVKNKPSNSTTSIVSNQNYVITGAGYSLDGIILRDKRTEIEGDSDLYQDPKIHKTWYKNLSPISLDPSIISAERSEGQNKRNPPLVEKKEIVYEFHDDYFIQSDEIESKKQAPTTPVSAKNPLTSRNKRKTDVLSLSLISPNALIEKIEGTVVDTNGNILDLNRHVLPIGGKDGLATLKGTPESFQQVRDLHRKGIAFHWELNARKDETKPETGKGNDYCPDGDPTYKRGRSRFYFDVDKEGQFKLNVPSSSETGNVGLLTRYENYSTINPREKDNAVDYDYFVKSKEANVDILIDQFGIRSPVELSGNDKLIPKDRTGTTIAVGTAFHDISKTCVYPIDTASIYRSGIFSGPDFTTTDFDGNARIVLKNTSIDSVVSKTIYTDGDKANSGGRSGTLVFDGMLNFSIGANTADRQSLWLDLQGGMVQRIGSDKNGISSITQTDGDVYLQIGGDPGFRTSDGEISIVDPDKRFNSTNTVIPTSNKANVFELRVIQGNGQYCRIVVDNKGVSIISPKTIEFRSDEDIILYAEKQIMLNAEAVFCHKSDVKDFSVPASRQTRDYQLVYEADASGDGVAIVKPFLGSQQVLG